MSDFKFNITIEDIKDKMTFYDIEEYFVKGWRGTLIDILNINELSFENRLWIVTHFLGDKLNRLFAVYCARQALNLIKEPNPKSINACDVAEKFALGKATIEELREAKFAARDAVGDVTGNAAWTPSWAAVWVGNTNVDVIWIVAWAVVWAGIAVLDDFKRYLIMLIQDELTKDR